MKPHSFHPIGTLVVLALTAIQGFAQSTYEPYTFTTLAGGAGFKSPDVAGNVGRFQNLDDVAVDSAGNVYVTDVFNHAIRKVTPTGIVTTLAGLPGTFGSADGTGSDARFNFPAKLVVDGAGNVYVSDFGSTIRKVTPQGEVTTLAGGRGSFGTANGTGSDARFNSPEGIAVDRAGNLYVADVGNHTIRKVTPTGTNWVVTTLAGLAGVIGSANGTNSAARFYYAKAVAVDSAGNLYVADTDNHTIRKVSPTGTNWVVTTIAGRAGIPGSIDGTNSAARFTDPKGVTVDSAGNIYVADEGNHTIRMVTPVGTNWVVSTPAGLANNPGSADGTGSAARFSFPYGVAADSSGNVYASENGGRAVRKLTPVGTNWVVTTRARLGGNYGSMDGPGNVALFKGTGAVAVDSAGNAYVADQFNHTIRKMTAAGEVTTLAGLAGYGGSSNGTNSAARFWDPASVVPDSAGILYVADAGNSTIRKMAPVGTNWVVTTLAGLARNYGSTDGTGSAARFFGPSGMAVDSAGNVCVADTYNSTIRRVSPTGIVTTRAGSSGQNGPDDGIGAEARFHWPGGVAVDGATNIYVADTWNHTIRKITPERLVTTIAAGLAENSGSADGSGKAARFNFPSGIAADRTGNVYVADAYNNTIRKLTPLGTNWVVTTLGGMAGIFGTTDGPGKAARFCNPNGVAVDNAGNIYVADFYFSTIRKGYPPLRMLNSGFTAGQFSFDISGPPGQPVVVEASPDLVSWLPTWTNTFGAGALPFSDPQNSVTSHRFYRARTP